MDNPDSKHPADEPVSEGIPAPDGPANLIDTDYVIGQDNITTSAMGFNLDLHGKVFTISSLVVLLFVILTLALQDTISPIYDAVFGFLTGNLAWFFILAANIFVILCLGLIVSPLGKIRIGGADAKPDFTYAGWFSMLFAAGMGIGLMFFGVNEPLTHFGTSLEGGDWAPLAGAEGDTQAQRRWAWRQRSSTGVCIRGRFMRGGSVIGAILVQQRLAALHALGVLPATG